MNQEKINHILKEHEEWLNDKTKGHKACFTRADLRNANFRNADLKGACLRNAYIAVANFRGADLRDADLREVDLIRTNLAGADLRNANLIGAYLKRLIEINGSVHRLQYYNNQLRIGCYEYPLAYWLIMYDTIGRENDYTEEQIREYKAYMDMLKQFYK